jgi:hypothetical protein
MLFRGGHPVKTLYAEGQPVNAIEGKANRLKLFMQKASS